MTVPFYVGRYYDVRMMWRRCVLESRDCHVIVDCRAAVDMIRIVENDRCRARPIFMVIVYGSLHALGG